MQMSCFPRLGRRATLLVAIFVASIMACERHEANLPALPGFEGVQDPIHIVRAGLYLDGGTCSAELRDGTGQRFYVGFDGRMYFGEGSWPWHCFVGAEHPTRVDARMLPLWGQEERAMVAIANAAIDATLSSWQRTAILRTDARVLPKGVDHGVAVFVVRTQRRMETLEALDHGELEGLGATLAYFKARAPLAVERIREKSDASGFDATVVDRDGKSWQVSLPSSMDSASAITTARYRLKSQNGSHQERLLLTLLSHALKNPTASSDTARSALIQQIERRRARILADDRTR